jgi:hypothetical protein
MRNHHGHFGESVRVDRHSVDKGDSFTEILWSSSVPNRYDDPEIVVPSLVRKS